MSFDQQTDQDRLFDGLGFTKIMMHYEFGDLPCFLSPHGHYYRVDHFSNLYVIEFAGTDEEAKNNCFEDGDLFSDDLSPEELKKQIQENILKDLGET